MEILTISKDNKKFRIKKSFFILFYYNVFTQTFNTFLFLKLFLTC